MLGCSSRHAKALRLSEIAESITAILAACHDDPGKCEAFRRHCLTALSAEPAPDLTPDLILEAAQASADMVVAMQAATVDGQITETERRTLVRLQREELGADANLIRALENR